RAPSRARTPRSTPGPPRRCGRRSTMSSVPSGGPTPGHPHGGSTRPETQLSWRVRHSWWLLLPLLGCSCLGGFGFLYVGLRAKRPAWWLPGIVYLIVGWTAFIVVGEVEPETIAADISVGVMLATWVGSIFHACLINPAWLRWRAAHTPWYQRPPLAPPPTWPGPGASPT